MVLSRIGNMSGYFFILKLRFFLIVFIVEVIRDIAETETETFIFLDFFTKI